eukprot:1661764-Amphidinium_carterae.1
MCTAHARCLLSPPRARLCSRSCESYFAPLWAKSAPPLLCLGLLDDPSRVRRARPAATHAGHPTL